MNIASQLRHMLYIASMHGYKITKFEMPRDMLLQLIVETQDSYQMVSNYEITSGPSNHKFCGVPVITSDIDYIHIETNAAAEPIKYAGDFK